jgi:hypothetical protein
MRWVRWPLGLLAIDHADIFMVIAATATVPGFHELCHHFVVAGNAIFVVVIWLWVLPTLHS